SRRNERSPAAGRGRDRAPARAGARAHALAGHCATRPRPGLRAGHGAARRRAAGAPAGLRSRVHRRCAVGIAPRAVRAAVRHGVRGDPAARPGALPARRRAVGDLRRDLRARELRPLWPGPEELRARRRAALGAPGGPRAGLGHPARPVRRAVARPVPAAPGRGRPRRLLAGARHAELARPAVNRLTPTGAPSDATVERRLTGIAVLVVAIWMLLLTRLF